MVTNKPRAASAYAMGDMKCLGKVKCSETQSFKEFVSVDATAAHKKNENEVRFGYKVALFPPASGKISAPKALT